MLYHDKSWMSRKMHDLIVYTYVYARVMYDKNIHIRTLNLIRNYRHSGLNALLCIYICIFKSTIRNLKTLLELSRINLYSRHIVLIFISRCEIRLCEQPIQDVSCLDLFVIIICSSNLKNHVQYIHIVFCNKIAVQLIRYYYINIYNARIKLAINCARNCCASCTYIYTRNTGLYLFCI